MKRFSFFLPMLLVALCTGTLFAAGQSDGTRETLGPIVMKVSGSGIPTEGNLNYVTVLRFQELVEEYTNGEVVVELFPQGTFGSEVDAVLAVRDGEVHMFTLASNNLAVHAPSIFPLSFPYMFESFEEVQEVVESPFGDQLAERVLDESGVMILGYHWSGWRVVSNSVRPIKTLEDMRGMKIRVPMSATIVETFKAWGVNPTPIAWNETFAALQQGVVDGFDNPIVVIGSFGFYEVQDYLTELKYQPQMIVDIMNKEFYDSLSAEHQAAIQKAFTEASYETQDYIRNETETYRQLSIDNGMEVYQLPPAEEQRWREAAMSAWPILYKDASGEAWVQEFHNAVLEIRNN